MNPCGCAGPCFGMHRKAQTTAIAQLWRGFASSQGAQSGVLRAAGDLFSVALALASEPAAGPALPKLTALRIDSPCAQGRSAIVLHTDRSFDVLALASRWARSGPPRPPAPGA